MTVNKRVGTIATQILLYQSELAIDSTIETSGDSNLLLIGKTLRVLGIRRQLLRPIEGASIRLLLDTNDLYYREVETPKIISTAEYNPLLLFRRDNKEPKLLYRKGLRNYIYCPQANASFKLDSNDPQVAMLYEPTAIEIYAPLEKTSIKPLDVLKFAFSAQALRSSLVSLLICTAVIIGFNLLIPLLTRFLVRRVLPDADGELLIFSSVIATIIIVALSVAAYLQARMLLRIQIYADRRLQSAIWDKLLKLPMSFLSKYSAGDLASRAQSISQMQQILNNGVISSSLGLFFSISYFVLMFIFDRGLTFWALGFTILSFTIITWLCYIQIKLQRPLQERGAEITNFALQAIYGLPQIRSAGAEPFVLLRWLSKVNDYSLTQLKINKFADAQLVYANTVGSIGLMLIFAILTNRIFNAKDLPSLTSIVVAFLSFNSAFQMFNASLSTLIGQVSTAVGQSAVLWERSIPIIREQEEFGYQSNAILHTLNGKYVFRNVSHIFAGSNDRLFTNLNFTTVPGGHTAITGSTGSGKTTVLRMMLGFVTPNQGDVLVDDISVSKLAIRQYRRQIGVVMQSIRFGSGSIYNLIRCGLPISREEIWDCLEKTGFADEVNYLPLKLDTYISEGATNLSGGQKQKLAIARALVRKPKVLLMDEATSSLDNSSQERITQLLDNIGVTRITVAHRLSTIRSADRVVIIGEGRVLEAGTPDDLFHKGEYLKRNLDIINR